MSRVDRRMRTISAIIDSSVDNAFDAAIQAKSQELQMLHGDKQNLDLEIRDLRGRLMDKDISVPEVDSTRNYENAKNIPLASVADNISMAEDMINYKTGERDALLEALNSFKQGEALMKNLSSEYSALNQPAPDPNFPGDEWLAPDSYKRLMVEGSIGQPETEMGQMFQSLDKDVQGRLDPNSPTYDMQFAEGFSAGKVGFEDAQNKALKLLEAQKFRQDLYLTKKEAIQGDISNQRIILDKMENDYGVQLFSNVNVNGSSFSSIINALNAGDDENGYERLNAVQENIMEGDSKIIGSELISIMNGAMLDPSAPYRGLYGTLGIAYSEFQELEEMKENWTNNSLPWEAAKSGLWNQIPEDFMDDAKRINLLYSRNLEFRKAGVWSTDDTVFQDIEAALLFNDANEELTAIELDMFNKRSYEDINKMFSTGVGVDFDKLETALQGDDYGFDDDQVDYIRNLSTAIDLYNETTGGDVNSDVDPDSLANPIGPNVMTFKELGFDIGNPNIPTNPQARGAMYNETYNVELKVPDLINNGYLDEVTLLQHKSDSVKGAKISRDGVDYIVENTVVNENGEIELELVPASRGMAPWQKGLGTKASWGNPRYGRFKLNDFDIIQLAKGYGNMPGQLDLGKTYSSASYYFDPISNTYVINSKNISRGK